MHPLHDQVLDAIDAFPPAVDGHQARFQELAPLLFRNALPYHGIDHAVFVFKSHEGDATGGLRPLAHSDESGEAHVLPVGRLGEIGRRQAAPCGELFADEAQRVPAQGEADGRVVGGHVLADAGQRDGEVGLGGLHMHRRCTLAK